MTAVAQPGGTAGPGTKRARRFVYNLLNPTDENRLGRSLDSFIVLLIALNVVVVMIETDERAAAAYSAWFVGFEWFSSLFFTLEYVLRLWTCVEDERFRHPLWGRLRYARSFMAVIDILAILPFYLPMLIELDLRFVRAVRLFRLFRLFKVGRYAQSIKLIGQVLSSRKEELALTVFVVSILLVMASSVIFYAENGAQPDKFTSIPATMWWGVVTLTTVGYGDLYPVTPIGKFLGGCIALLGVGIVALPAGILASGFNEALAARKAAKNQQSTRYCPHCGGDLLTAAPLSAHLTGSGLHAPEAVPVPAEPGAEGRGSESEPEKR